MESVRRLHTVLGHINGHAEEPLWVALMDAGHNPVSKPRYGCRCSAEKWQYVCKCYPCLRRAGREEDFDWTPDIIGAQPQFIPPQWRSKAGLRAVACAGDLPRPSPKRQPELVTSEGATPRMRLPDVPGAPWAPPFGPVAIGALPRFAGMATFARLPQLQELRSLQAARTAVLRLRPKEAKSGALARLRGGAMGDFEAIGEEVSLSVSEEHSNLEVELQGMQATLALWTLPDAWHRHIFEFPSPNGKISRLEMEIFLEKRLEQFDIALVGVPFDTGCSFRPGARFGPEAIRSNSRLTRPYLIAQQQRPLQDRQVVDTGDVFATPFNIDQAVQQIYEGCKERLQMSRRLVVFGGDHTLSYPSIKAVAERFGPVVLVHFDSHLDTFPKLWGQDVWHGAPFRNCWAEVGWRSATESTESTTKKRRSNPVKDVHEKGVEACVDVVRRRWQDSGGAPVYLSVDIDVLDPSVAPGTGTPEFGGLLAHQLLQFIRGITSMAAANVMLEQIGLISSCMDSDGFTS
ncbi:unnamed protein product [Durusdinium trenchii]|uniref:Agmatinase n=1 Tax=Durusdinium trenchii TaxID=1381693 RepID=A0ABP0HE00_9DINO